MTKNENCPSLEASLQEINGLIDQMEKDELTLEQSLSHFERGITLIKNAQKILQEAEQKVKILTKSATGNDILTPFESPEE